MRLYACKTEKHKDESLDNNGIRHWTLLSVAAALFEKVVIQSVNRVGAQNRKGG